MNFSVESRAISSFDQRSDIFVTMVHLPYHVSQAVPAFLAECVGVPEWCANNFDQFVDLAVHGPKPHGHNGAYRPNYEKIPSWLATQNAFVQQSLLVQLARRRPSMIVDDDLQQVTLQNLDRRNLGSNSLERWMDEVAQSQFLRERNIGKTSGEFLAAYSMILDGLILSPDELTQSERYLQDSLRHYQIPLSHSPEIGVITLQSLLNGGIRSACLIPLATGIYAGHANLMGGDILTGFQLVGGGAGMTICALSTLWIADKIMRGIKGFGGEQIALQNAELAMPKK